MRHIDTDDATGFFEIVGATDRSKAATMILESNRSTGGPENRHPDSDQWLYVKSGDGTVTVDGETRDVSPGDLLLIEAGEAHEVAAGDREPLVTVNVYAPPDY